MHFTEEQSVEVKKWVVQRLEDISDADSDVLADYVLALICSDAPDDEIKRNSIENLEDFLKEHTAGFVDEIFERYNPKPVPAPLAATPAVPQPAPVPASQTEYTPTAPGIQASSSISSFGGNAAQFGRPDAQKYGAPYNGELNTSPGFSRKRGFNEGHHGENDYDGFRGRGGERPLKAPRGPRAQQARGAFGGIVNGRPGSRFPPNGAQPNLFPQPGQLPAPPAGFPPFDPNDPMSAMMALQAMGFPSGMPPLPGLPPTTPGAPGAPSPAPPKIPQPCRDYETQGFCILGSGCPYQHGPDHVVASRDNEYDPTKSNVVLDRPSHHHHQTSRGGGREGRGGRGRGRGDGQPRMGRAEYSRIGLNDDKSITTIVVEQIPEEKFNEEAVRGFFSEFGTITEVTLKPQRRLALVKYDTYASARRAWESPKVIFDNRFVKVYWYKPPIEKDTTMGGTDETPAIDPEEFEKQQAEAQRIHEEKMKKREAMEQARVQLEKQKEELMKRQAEERARLMEKLKAKEAGRPTSASPTTTTEVDISNDPNASEQTKALRAQLAALEAEAKSLGIDPNQEESSSRGRGGFRGGYRGRGAPRGRGGFQSGYDPSFRGGFRGRGGAPRGRGTVLRLDNRPKRVAISGVEFSPQKEEALRFYLMGVGDYDGIERNPARSDSVIVSFKERYIAEQLYYGGTDIPNVGSVEFSWVAGPSPAAAAASASSATAAPSSASKLVTEQKDDGSDTVMGEGNGTVRNNETETRKEANGPHDVDYDVAEDEWME
ncbi:hypothetical protein KEM56_006230 [Ascosphaera pollenicola]|nr:hypothetical protein KEM56_006230 [Ascosphaera pollenicola]